MLPNNTRCDLHIHTNRSDGCFSPREVIQRAADSGLSVIALTDHDLPTHLHTERIALGGQKLWLIAAAEISVSHDGYEYHMLAYFPRRVPEKFIQFCRVQCQSRAQRYDSVRAKIGEQNIPKSDVAAVNGERALTRLHLARALVDAGRATNIRRAFSDFLNLDMGNVPVISPPAGETIRFIRSLGGLVSWAHPPTMGLHNHLDDFVESGLNGLEAYRPKCSKSDKTLCQKLARKHGLFLTGGSDWHGWNNPNDLGLFSLTAPQLGGFIHALGLHD